MNGAVLILAATLSLRWTTELDSTRRRFGLLSPARPQATGFGIRPRPAFHCWMVPALKRRKLLATAVALEQHFACVKAFFRFRCLEVRPGSAEFRIKHEHLDPVTWIFVTVGLDCTFRRTSRLDDLGDMRRNINIDSHPPW